MNDEGIYADFSGAELTPVPEVQPEAFVLTPELQADVESALFKIKVRELFKAPPSFSKRNPQLGKMINCQVCDRRHRASEVHEQVFTYRVGDYELFRENEEGDLVPDYRIAMQPDVQPTTKQVVGAAAFAKKRFHPHLSKIKLLFVQRTREVFQDLGFSLDDEGETFQKNLQRARVVAARQIRKEARTARKFRTKRADQSRRINRELITRSLL